MLSAEPCIIIITPRLTVICILNFGPLAAGYRGIRWLRGIDTRKPARLPFKSSAMKFQVLSLLNELMCCKTVSMAGRLVMDRQPTEQIATENKIKSVLEINNFLLCASSSPPHTTNP